MQNNEDFKKLHLLKTLKKLYPKDFIRPLFMAIINRSQYSTYSNLVKDAYSGSLIWKRFFTKPDPKSASPFDLALNYIDNNLLHELYSISLMKEDSYMESQFIKLPESS